MNTEILISGLKNFALTFADMFVEMAPFLLLGFLLAGILHVWIPKESYIPKINKPTFKSVFLSSLFGIPLPICSCGVIPTAVALRKEGASKGASVGFLISTPATGVDSILATYSLLGLPFAILRPVAAFISSLFGGVLTNIVTKGEEAEDLTKLEAPKSCCCGGHEEKPKAEEHCCCHKEEKPKAEEHCCCHKESHDHEESHAHGFADKLKETFNYGFGDLLPEISKWLVIGLVLGALIAAFVPNELFMKLREYPTLSMFLVLVISMPMYTCSTGSIPLALALMAKGLPPGAALVLLMAGPATSIASMVVVGKSFGKRTLIAYLFSIGAGALFFGWLVNTFFMDLFVGPGIASIVSHEDCSCWYDYLFAAILASLMVRGLVMHKHKDGCSCGSC